jgi:hypothetical protein
MGPNDLVSALQQLGWDKKSATSAAIQAITENPTNFDAALRRAMQLRSQPPVSGASNDLATKTQAEQIRKLSGKSK